MQDISVKIDAYLKKLKSSCQYNDGIGCKNPNACACSSMAEFFAIRDEIIPSSCAHLEFRDFQGDVPGDGCVLSQSVVDSARKKIARYCWGYHKDATKPDFDTNSPDATGSSIIEVRRKEGTNLVIHGQSAINEEHKKLGRSLLASVVMKEVIKRRIFTGVSADSYEWVQYQTMKIRSMNYANEDAIIDYKFSDWLVVDNIYEDHGGSAEQRSFSQNRLDTIFMERIELKLPTILVFQFDITGCNLAKMFGIGISQIAQNDNTFKVSLTSK